MPNPTVLMDKLRILTDAAKFAETKFIIKDMAGINIPAAE